MKEAIVAKGPKVSLHNIAIPTPTAGQVLINVIFSGSNSKNWKMPDIGEPHNSGDDIARVIDAVWQNTMEFKEGGRVAVFHEMATPNGTFVEYVIAWAHTSA